MKKRVKIFRINETFGYFLGTEEELCKRYCRIHGYTYRVDYMIFWIKNFVKPIDK